MDIMNKTYELIMAIEESDLFKEMDMYKKRIMNNGELKDLIDKGNKEEDEYVLLDMKKNLYKYEEYREYMRLYSEIMYIVMDINKRYRDLFNERKCSI